MAVASGLEKDGCERKAEEKIQCRSTHVKKLGTLTYSYVRTLGT